MGIKSDLRCARWSLNPLIPLVSDSAGQVTRYER